VFAIDDETERAERSVRLPRLGDLVAVPQGKEPRPRRLHGRLQALQTVSK
jgi:hypothetical protein